MSTQYYVQTEMVGGSGSTSFDSVSVTASPIKTMNVWSDNAAILAMQFIFVDGTNLTYGQPRSGLSEINLKPGEQVTFLTMLKTDGTTTGGHQVVGQIILQTNLGQNVSVGPGGSYTYTIPLASGIFIGVVGSYGDAIDALAFYCLKPIQSVAVSIDPTQFANMVGTSVGIAPDAVVTSTYIAPPDGTLPYTFEGQRTVTSSTSFSQASTTSYGVSVTVSGEFLGIGASTTGTWDQSSETTTTSSSEVSISVGGTVSGVVPQNCYVVASTTCFLGNVNLPYTSDVTITFIDSTIPPLSFSERGVYNNVTYADARTTVSDPTPNGSISSIKKLAAPTTSEKIAGQPIISVTPIEI